MTDDKFFNLIDEPWIPVLTASGEAREVSLREVFRLAPELTAITGELPTQTVAILRMLLAIIHRAVSGPTSLEDWKELRDNWDAVLDDVEVYFDDFYDRFWLFHPDKPFMQVADLRTAKDEISELAKIICDGPSSSPFLATRIGDSIGRLSAAEAARWLLTTQAYDISGIKSGAIGDPRVKGGKGYPIGTGWAGQIGAVYLVGNNLRETLLLNLIAPKAVPSLDWNIDKDLPIWERVPDTALPELWTSDGGANQPYRQPTGLIDLYTWPARRIRLVRDGQDVTGVVLAQGDRATPQDRQTVEPMTAWRYSEPQTKKFGHDTYMPLKHEPQRAFWRGLESLLPFESQAVRPGGPPRRLPPALATWAARLETEKALSNSQLKWRAIGVEYGSNESVYDDIVDDEVVLPGAIFVSERLAQLAIEAVAVADASVRTLGNFGQNIALAAGASSENDGPRLRAIAVAYADLDREFRQWIRTLTDESDAEKRGLDWQQVVKQVISSLANKLLESAGGSAYVGRWLGPPGKKRLYDAGSALHWFNKAMRETLPLAYPTTNQTANGYQSKEVTP